MSRQDGKRSGHGGRALRSAGWQAVKLTARAADKAAGYLARWITTDHAGVGKALLNMGAGFDASQEDSA